jgi:putative peptidoglycan lipid II flippase
MTLAAEAKLTRIFAGLLPLNIAVQLVSFAAWVVFAHVLGTSTSTDAYILGLSVPVLVYGILLTAIRVGAIPGLTEEASKKGSEARAANELVSASLAASAALALIVTVVAVAAAPLVLRNDAQLLRETRLTMIELSPLAVLGALTGVLSAILAVRRSFAPAAAVLAFDPLFRVCFVWAWGGSLGIHALVLANLLGGAAAAATLWVIVRHAGVPLRLVRPARSAFVRSVVGVSAPLIVSASVLEVNPLVDRTMAGGLRAGSVTGLELGMRLVPGGLFVAVVVSPLVATWSARRAQYGWPALRDSVHRALSAGATFVLPIVVIGIILRHEAVTFAYNGGAFSEDAAAKTAAVFGMSLLGLPAQILSVILTTLFIVERETRFPMKIGFINVILNVALNFAFRPLFGVAGIALSTSLTYAILNVIQVKAVRRRWGRILPSSAMAPLIAIGGALLLAAIAAEALLQRLPAGTSRLQALLVIVMVGGAGVLVYAAALLVGRRLISRTPRDVVVRSGMETRT